MNKTALYSILSRYKYLITFIIGIFIVGFADSNSLYHRVLLQYEIQDLKSEIEQYTKIYEDDKSQLRDLERDPRNIERIARERYFMKTDDEDIFVLSTDPRSINDFPTNKSDESEH
ncbi:MAG: septum formation initiator family protein [Prevotella sp.]|nr:septum formation initiator family protein [Prevotella sp.]